MYACMCVSIYRGYIYVSDIDIGDIYVCMYVYVCICIGMSIYKLTLLSDLA